MTTTVKRGAGRPAAAAKRKKHAQRTPLPPRGRSGVAGGGPTAKVLKDERERQQRAAIVSDNPLLDKSLRKANEAADVATAHGWKTQVKVGPGTFVKVWAERATNGTTETVTCSWEDGRMSMEDMPKVIIENKAGAHREVLLRNASAFKQQVSKDSDRPVALAVKSTRTAKRDGNGDVTGVLPFTETATDVVVLDALRGAQITWRNGLASGRVEQGTINAKVRHGMHYRITPHPNKAGERILHFIDEETKQHRAVALSKIVRVLR